MGTTSSSSEPAPAAARSPAISRRPASGSCCWNAVAGCPASRRTGRPPTCSWTTATSRRTPGSTSRASRSSRRSTTSSAARRSCTAPRCTGCGREDFGELRHHDGISPAWPISYVDMEPYYTAAEQMYQVHGVARRGPDRAAGERAVPVPGRCRTSRASSSSPTTWRRPGIHPFHAPCGVLLNEANMPYSTCVRCATVRRIPVPVAREGGRGGDGRPAGAGVRRTSRC